MYALAEDPDSVPSTYTTHNRLRLQSKGIQGPLLASVYTGTQMSGMTLCALVILVRWVHIQMGEVRVGGVAL